MNQPFVPPQAEIVVFANEDVIATSGNGGGDPLDPKDEEMFNFDLGDSGPSQ